MRIILTLSLLALSQLLYAVDGAPKNFSVGKRSAVFVDFRTATYHLVFDFKDRSSRANSVITFYQDEPGHPIFDLQNKMLSLEIDGHASSAERVTPPGSETSVLIVSERLEPGFHTLRIRHHIDEFSGPLFKENNYLDVFLSLSDLDDPGFLDVFVPANFEYDKVAMTFDVLVKNSTETHKLYHNGQSTELGRNHFRITFPDYFTASSPYIHVLKKNLYPELTFDYSSITGKSFPVTIYGDSEALIERTKTETLSVLKELESVIAPWPHPALTIQVYEGGAGMEYPGALVGGDVAIRHEIIHNYFARGVMPLDGESGWIDESLTMWIEHGYKADDQFPIRGNGSRVSPMVRRSLSYLRKTNLSGYDGQAYFEYLNLKLSKEGGLKPFLPYFFNKHKFKPVTTQILKDDLEFFFNRSFTEDFETYIY